MNESLLANQAITVIYNTIHSTLLASFPGKPLNYCVALTLQAALSNPYLLLWVELMHGVPIPHTIVHYLLYAVPCMLCRHVLVTVTTEGSSVPLSMMISPSERTLLGFFMIVSAWVASYKGLSGWVDQPCCILFSQSHANKFEAFNLSPLAAFVCLSQWMKAASVHAWTTYSIFVKNST